jgi:hypothetical protein
LCQDYKALHAASMRDINAHSNVLLSDMLLVQYSNRVLADRMHNHMGEMHVHVCRYAHAGWLTWKRGYCRGKHVIMTAPSLVFNLSSQQLRHMLEGTVVCVGVLVSVLLPGTQSIL